MRGLGAVVDACPVDGAGVVGACAVDGAGVVGTMIGALGRKVAGVSRAVPFDADAETRCGRVVDGIVLVVGAVPVVPDGAAGEGATGGAGAASGWLTTIWLGATSGGATA